LADPQRALAGCRAIPAQEAGGHLEENAPAVGQPRAAQVIIESGGSVTSRQRSKRLLSGPKRHRQTNQRRAGANALSVRLVQAEMMMCASGPTHTLAETQQNLQAFQSILLTRPELASL
jgi:hypothetical protein